MPAPAPVLLQNVPTGAISSPGNVNAPNVAGGVGGTQEITINVPLNVDGNVLAEAIAKVVRSTSGGGELVTEVGNMIGSRQQSRRTPVGGGTR